MSSGPARQRRPAAVVEEKMADVVGTVRFGSRAAMASFEAEI